MSAVRIGILGGGQLAAMLIEASAKLPEVEISLFCESDDEATRNFKNRTISSLGDSTTLARWATTVDAITFEHEHVDLALLHKVPGINEKLRPNGNCVAIAQDRELEKKTFERLEIPVAPWCALGPNLSPVCNELLPGIVKTATHGYDGKGQVSVRSVEELSTATSQIGEHRCVLEKRIAFLREVSQVSVRSFDGTISHYPLVENVHRSGILSVTKVPTTHFAEIAQNYTAKLATELEYVGVLAVEFFVVDDGLLANEWAPRVHNSGHWTIEGATTSQFENHLRAVAGLAIGDCASAQPTTMWNIFGVDRKNAEEAIASVQNEHPNTKIFLHWYGKTPRLGRKVGHITICEPSESPANRAMSILAGTLQKSG